MKCIGSNGYDMSFHTLGFSGNYTKAMCRTSDDDARTRQGIGLELL